MCTFKQQTIVFRDKNTLDENENNKNDLFKVVVS